MQYDYNASANPCPRMQNTDFYSVSILPPRLPIHPGSGTFISKEQLEPILQRPHIRILVTLQLKGIGNDFDGPVGLRSVLSGFEAQVEVARVFGVETEGVHAALGVGFGVGCEPLFYEAGQLDLCMF